MDRHHFLLRRLHSLSGIVPVGLFVIAHLFTNFQIIAGDFQHEVEFIHSLPALFIIELTLWLSIGFHAGLGLVYTLGSKPNVNRYPYQSNWRYTLQRTSGYLALVFIFLHVATLRWRWSMFGWFTPFFVAGPEGQPLVAATTANALQHSVLVLIVYVIGAVSVIFHWSNGLWTAAISWGLTVSVAAQRRWGYACIGLGIALMVFAGGAIYGAKMRPITDQDRAAIRAAIEAYQAGVELPEKANRTITEAH